MKKNTILHKIGQLIVPLKRTVSPLEADWESAPGGLENSLKKVSLLHRPTKLTSPTHEVNSPGTCTYLTRITLLLLLMMILGVGNTWGQEPVTITTDVNNKVLYLIQSFNNEAFYIRNDTRNGSKKNLNTSNIVTTNSEFYFLDADIIDGTQYYYIVHNGTGKYVHVASAASGQALIYDNAPAANATDDTKDLYRFKIIKNSSRDAYNIIAKNSELSLSKKNANSIGDFIELNSADSEISCWNFIAKTNYSKPAAPFNLSSLNGAKHKYYIQNNKYTTYYLISGQQYVTTNTQTDDNKADMKWYFVKAPASENDPYMDFYYIIHAQTGQYLRYRLDKTPENADHAVELSDYNSSENDRFLFIIVRGSVSGETSTTYSTTYCIAPYLSRVTRVDNTISLCYKKVSSDGGGSAYTDAGVFKERADNNFTHWNFISATLGCEAPEIGYADDGKIQVTCETDNVTIWYTTDTNSVLDPSDVTTFTLTVDDPVITYDAATNKAMISCTTPGASILYTTSDGEPTIPYPSGGIPLAIGDETIKAIAKKGGVSTTTPVTITVPFQTTVGEDKRPYIIQSKYCKFYNMIPNLSVDDDTKNVSTLNVPCSTMAWCFEYAEEGYYYIVDVNGWYMNYTTNTNKHVYLKSSKDDSDGFKFSITAHTNGGYSIIPKGQTKPIYKINSGSDPVLKPIMYDGTLGNEVARWDIIPYSTANLPMWDDSPFNVSTDNVTYYYTITPLSKNTDDDRRPLIINNSGVVNSEKVPEGLDSRKTMWVIKKVGAYNATDNPTGDNNELLDYYTIQNVYTGELIYYNGNGNGDGRFKQTPTFQMGEPSVMGADETWSHFVIVQTASKYNIIPRFFVDNVKAIDRNSTPHYGFNCLNRSDGNDILGTFFDDGDGSRWTFDLKDNVKCMEPVFTEDSNGDITITTVTNAAKIRYTVDGVDPIASSAVYTTKEKTSAQKVIKAIAIMGNDASTASNVVTLLNMPDIILKNGDNVVNENTYTYNGDVKEPTVFEVSIGEVPNKTSATAGTDYETVESTDYSNNTNASTDAVKAKVTLRDKESNVYVWHAEKEFIINRAPVTVTADDITKEYGIADPELTAIVEGVVSGQESPISYTISRAGGEDVGGTYTITPTGEAVQGNYNVSYVDGTLTITPKAVTVTANNQTKTYGDVDPVLSVTIEGLVNNDPESVISYTISREEGVNVGEYTITPTGEAFQGNYTVTYPTGTLKISKRPVRVVSGLTAVDKEYDGTDNATLVTTSATFGEGDIITGDNLTIDSATGTFDTKDMKWYKISKSERSR